jgi:hypothetical protein
MLSTGQQSASGADDSSRAVGPLPFPPSLPESVALVLTLRETLDTTLYLAALFSSGWNSSSPQSGKTRIARCRSENDGFFILPRMKKRVTSIVSVKGQNAMIFSRSIPLSVLREKITCRALYTATGVYKTRGIATIRAKLGHLAELDMSRLSSYDTVATSLVIAPNVQKWYTMTGTQSSIFVAQWRDIAPNGLLAANHRRLERAYA